MDSDLLTYGSIAAVAALLGGFWSNARNFFSYVAGFVILQHTLHPIISERVWSYLRANETKLPSGLAYFDGDYTQRKNLIERMTMSRAHTHKDEQGKLVKCYHESVQLLGSWQFWAGMTFGFPIEHFIWTTVPGFLHISRLLGL